MSTIGRFTGKEAVDQIQSQLRTTVQTAFYQNNVENVKTVAYAYERARRCPGTIELTGISVHEAEKQGLPEHANALLFNNGNTFGRIAGARKILGEPGVDPEDYSALVRDAIYHTRMKKLYHGEVIIGLHRQFMVKAHLLIPEDHEHLLYSWMLNFQYVNEIYSEIYKHSKKIPEGDILIFADPDWSHPDHPLGLVLFDPEHNCAVILGMKYFGEYKKSTLTLAWGIAARNGYAACHGGLKSYNLPGRKETMAVFGLSGSGKSTLTHAQHEGRFNITVLHDDAFIINMEDQSSIALEPTYFDKTQDYPMGCQDNQFLLTMQNNGAMMYTDGKVYPVTEDLRNGNGRAIKSRLWTPDRVDRIGEPINSIFWIMKDPTLPPVIRVRGAALGSVMGATLATKRTSAEQMAPESDPDKLVMEPYANPFRTYPLEVDYEHFKKLFEDGVACYIINTGHFRGRKVTYTHTMDILEAIVNRTAEFQPWGCLEELEIMEMPEFNCSLESPQDREALARHFEERVRFVQDLTQKSGGTDALPNEAQEALQSVLSRISP